MYPKSSTSKHSSLFLASFPLLFLCISFLAIGCKSEKNVNSQALESKVSESSPASPKRDMEKAMDEEESSDLDQNMTRRTSDGINKPLDPITDLSKERLLEYNIHLTFQVNNIFLAREELIKIAKDTSILKNAHTNISYGSKQTVQAELYTPIDKIYDTILLLGKLGVLTNEDVVTQDWTEQNEAQKIKLYREEIRSSRRSRAANSGKAENWTWKDREELLERSEDNMDVAKLETWKIRDKVKWAKIHIVIYGTDISRGLEIPNFRNAFISSLNFLLELGYAIVWTIPSIALIFIIYLLYKRFRKKDY